MKLCIGSSQVNSLMLHTDSDDATLKSTDLQSGVTAYAKGQKVTGSGKAFSFAFYGGCESNTIIPIPVEAVNTVSVSSAGHPVKMAKPILDVRGYDFSTAKQVATVAVNGTDYPITVKVASRMITVSCDQTVTLQVLFGKDEYV